MRKKPTKDQILSYFEHPVLFVESGFVWIQDRIERSWTKFEPWPYQRKLLDDLYKGKKICIPKSRQIAVSTTVQLFALWQMLFRPISEIAYFSLGGREAKAALKRIRGTFDRLPDNIRPNITKSDQVNGIFQIEAPDGEKEGSIIYSLPNTAGESLTFNTLIIDEAGRMRNYSDLYGRTKPAIDDAINNGDGKLLVMGIYDKWNPDKLYRQQIMDGLAREDGWKTIFLPWSVRPDRNRDWFEKTKEELFRQFGSDDQRKQQFPETIEEMLSELETDKRIPSLMLDAVFEEDAPTVEIDLVLPGLIVYEDVEFGKDYVAAADVAEGLPTSDYNITKIVRKDDGVEVAVMRGRWQPEIHAAYSYQLCEYYNFAPLLPERNNHGHSFISNFVEIGDSVRLIEGPDGRAGWYNTGKHKVIAYDAFIKFLSESMENEERVIRHEVTRIELGTIMASTLSCPNGDGYYDDCAVTAVLSVMARELAKPKVTARTI